MLEKDMLKQAPCRHFRGRRDLNRDTDLSICDLKWNIFRGNYHKYICTDISQGLVLHGSPIYYYLTSDGWIVYLENKVTNQN